MKKKALYIPRQLLFGVIALQFLNLSVGSQAYWEGDYDYSYTYNKSYDPTESAVEWITSVPASPVAHIDLPTGRLPSHPNEILSPPPESRLL